MCAIDGNVEIPYFMVTYKDLKLHGKYTYGRKDAEAAIRMLESGRLKMGKDSGVKNVGPYGLKDIEKAMDDAANSPGWGQLVILTP